MGTPLHVVPRLEPFLGLFAEGALLCADAPGAKPERVSLIGALCCRESWVCDAPGYRPRGSVDGSGDWTARAGHWTTREGVKVIPDTAVGRAFLRSAGWSLPKRKDGTIVPGPYAIPMDGLGWGRGMLQADILGDHRAMIPPAGVSWPVDRQAATACAQLHLAREELAAYVALPPITCSCGECGKVLSFGAAVVCRYNAALASIERELRAGRHPDHATTGGDYGTDVAALEAAVIARWPDSGIELPRRTA